MFINLQIEFFLQSCPASIINGHDSRAIHKASASRGFYQVFGTLSFFFRVLTIRTDDNFTEPFLNENEGILQSRKKYPDDVENPANPAKPIAIDPLKPAANPINPTIYWLGPENAQMCKNRIFDNPHFHNFLLTGKNLHFLFLVLSSKRCVTAQGRVGNDVRVCGIEIRLYSLDRFPCNPKPISKTS